MFGLDLALLIAGILIAVGVIAIIHGLVSLKSVSRERKDRRRRNPP